LENSKGSIISKNKTKILFIRRTTKNCGMFMLQLKVAGMIINKQKTGFMIRLPKNTVINGFMWFFISIGTLLWAFLRDYNPAGVYEVLVLLSLLLVSIYYLIRCIRWLLRVNDTGLVMTEAFKKQMTCLYDDISLVTLKNTSLRIHRKGKKPLKISTLSEGYSDLVEKLQGLLLPFYINGKRLRYESVPIEIQIELLESMGISSTHNDIAKLITSISDSTEISIDPNEYLSLLASTTNEDDEPIRLSDDILFCSTANLNLFESYEATFLQLLTLVKDSLDLLELVVKTNFETGHLTVSFTYDNIEYLWQFSYNGGQFYTDVISRINDLLLTVVSTHYLYTCTSQYVPGILVISSTGEIVNQLNSLTDNPFILLSGRSVEWESPIVVQQNKSNLLAGILTVAVFGGFLILMLIINPTSNILIDTTYIILNICLLLLAILGILVIISTRRWRFTASTAEFSLRRMIGKEKFYPIYAITKAEIRTENLILYFNDQKIRISKNCENISLLLRYLETRGIQFLYLQ
ncbi:MAG: hypothetical protein FWG21_03480, partial [Oscillospiraceae bacterium]|nr:hypothetical protein [Oscillospiraceae bacterium]